MAEAVGIAEAVQVVMEAEEMDQIVVIVEVAQVVMEEKVDIEAAEEYLQER